MTTLHGRIEEGVLANLLQYLALSQASGCLLLRHPQSRQGSIYLERGRVVFVEAKPSYDVAALAAMLRWRDGQFSFRPGVRSPRITLDRSTAMLLLEATHLADESSDRGEEAGPQVDADTVLSALAERATARHQGARPSPGRGQPGRLPLDSGPLDSGPRDSGRLDSGRLDSGPLNSAPLGGGSLGGVQLGRAHAGDVPIGRERPERGASDRGAGGAARARAYAVLLPGARTAGQAADPGAAAGDASPGGVGTATGLPTPGPDPAAVAVAPDAAGGAGREAPLVTGEETVALSLSALLLYRRLDGQRSLREHATELSREPAEMVRAGRELLDARLAEYVTLVVADPRFVVELAREAVDLLGPVGEIVVEDALYDLGLSGDTLPVSSVDELVRELSSAFKNAFTRADFLRRVTELRRLFALEPTEPGRTR